MDQIVDILLKLAVPFGVAVIFIVAKKACRLVAKKLEVELSEQEWYLVDSIIENAVRATEMTNKDKTLSSEEKEDLALSKVKRELNGSGKDIPDASLRDRIKAKVSSIFKRD